MSTTPAGATIVTPTVTVTINGVETPIRQIALDLTVGSITPTASIMLATVDGNAAPVQAVDDAGYQASQVMGTAQAQIFGQITTPNVSIQISNAPTETAANGLTDAGSLEFQGYLTDPVFSTQPGNTGLGYRCVHASTILGLLRTYIYTPADPGAVNNGTAEKGGYYGSALKAGTDNLDSPELGLVLPGVLGIMVKYSKPEWSNLSKQTQAYLNAWAAANAAPLAAFQAVCAASISDPQTGFTGGNIATSNLNISDKVFICQTIQDLFLNKSDNFFSTLQALQETFQLLFIPAYGAPDSDPDAVGSFISWADVAITNAQTPTLLVTPLSLNFSGGNSHLLPYTQAIVVGNIADLTTIQSGTGSTINLSEAFPYPIVAGFPANSNAAMPLVDPGPQWLTPFTTDVAQSVLNITTTTGIDLTAFQTAYGDQNTASQDNIIAKETLITAWAKKVFAFVALDDATATIQVPFDPSLTPGTRYQVYTNGAVLFYGFLRQVQHTFNVESSGEAEATTYLTFSHLECGTYRLPTS